MVQFFPERLQWDIIVNYVIGNVSRQLPALITVSVSTSFCHTGCGEFILYLLVTIDEGVKLSLPWFFFFFSNCRDNTDNIHIVNDKLSTTALAVAPLHLSL